MAMMQNPEMMQQMMNSPIMQSLMSNPQVRIIINQSLYILCNPKKDSSRINIKYEKMVNRSVLYIYSSLSGPSQYALRESPSAATNRGSLYILTFKLFLDQVNDHSFTNLDANYVIVQSNPELGHVLNDPEMMRQTMEMVSDL